MARERNRLGRLQPGHKVYEEILNEPEIQKWKKKLEITRAPATAEKYIYYLHTLLKKLDLTPKQLLEHEDPIEIISDVLLDYTKDTPSIARGMRFAARHFFRSFKKPIEFDTEIIEPIGETTERFEKSEVVTKDMVYKIARGAKQLRDEAAILTLYQSGIRVGALLNLKYKHLKDNLFPIKEIPIPLEITRHEDTKISKRIGRYYTFIGEEAAKKLQEYLKTKYPLEDDDPVFSVTGNKKKVIKYDSFRDRFKAAVKRAKLDEEKIWIHLLRRTFSRTLERGNVEDTWIERLMGHTLPGTRMSYRRDSYIDIPELKKHYSKTDFSEFTGEGDVASIKRVERLEEEVQEKTEALEKLTQSYRDNLLIDYKEKITNAIYKAAEAVGEKERKAIDELSKSVLNYINEKWLKNFETPTVKEIHDAIEQVLIEEGHQEIAKAYILFRKNFKKETGREPFF
jgi:integrase